MKTLAVIKVTRAIRRLASAITPGTSPEYSDQMLREAVAEIAEAQRLGGVIARPEAEDVPIVRVRASEDQQSHEKG